MNNKIRRISRITDRQFPHNKGSIQFWNDDTHGAMIILKNELPKLKILIFYTINFRFLTRNPLFYSTKQWRRLSIFRTNWLDILNIKHGTNGRDPVLQRLPVVVAVTTVGILNVKHDHGGERVGSLPFVPTIVLSEMYLFQIMYVRIRMAKFRKGICPSFGRLKI